MDGSANEGAAPTSAGADTTALGGGASGAGARQKGRPQRPASTSTPAAAGWVGLKASCPWQGRADQRCGSWRRVRPGVAYFERKLPSLSAQASPQLKRASGSGCGLTHPVEQLRMKACRGDNGKSCSTRAGKPPAKPHPTSERGHSHWILHLYNRLLPPAPHSFIF